MAYEFKLPDIGEGLVEGEIVKWLVSEGDSVAEDQPMVEVMTDKATVELPAPVAGSVSSIRHGEGDVVPVGDVIIVIDDGGAAPEDAEAPKEAEPEPAPAEEKPAEPAPEEKKPAKQAPKVEKSAEPASKSKPHAGQRKRVLATPATRKLARDLGVEITDVAGSGPRGRVTKEDVRRAAESPAESTAAAPAPVEITTRREDERVPLRGLRRLISQSMARSKRTAAHFTIVEEAHVDELVRLREALKDQAAEAGVKLTYLPFVMKALVPLLREYPYMNASMDDAAQEIVLRGAINIGIAVDTDRGLTVPVVRDVPDKSVIEIAADLQEVSNRAREGKSTPEDISGGTFTITSTGQQGGLLATPVINHPEVAILGVHSIRKKPVVRNDEIVVGHVMNVSLSLDHRVVDGMTGARFLSGLVSYLTEPGRLLLGMR